MDTRYRDRGYEVKVTSQTEFGAIVTLFRDGRAVTALFFGTQHGDHRQPVSLYLDHIDPKELQHIYVDGDWQAGE